jgi:hypothetical protein
MEHDDTSANPPRTSKATPTERELSRMGREAVRQPPDPRLDKELERMGLMDAPDVAGSQPGQSRGRPVAVDPELERLRQRLRSVEVALLVVAVIAGVLAVIVVILLTR